ncbi:hypothetical protein [Legionella londiniensis]|uniref:Uncharacterized protein n=1 Tax=Legionella londiniensis TaxID=45068 RepID=A0A0W0VHI8_9GAMM|nr:hypothetical protein [Legionella londiniensis]KTD19583.1 hypothetical protein Llon_2163 [Legionella londiniensis]STX92194.1 Uncharacterised protein [Legionella londiniensis]
MQRLVFSMSFFLGLCLCAAGSMAESLLTCPSLASAQAGHNIWPHGSWLPLYTDNHELASIEDAAQFKKQITALEAVEWNANFPEMGHCYYRGNRQISLARDMLRPLVNDYPKWILNENNKEALCFTQNEDDCPFGGLG